MMMMMRDAERLTASLLQVPAKEEEEEAHCCAEDNDGDDAKRESCPIRLQ